MARGGLTGGPWGTLAQVEPARTAWKRRGEATRATAAPRVATLRAESIVRGRSKSARETRDRKRTVVLGKGDKEGRQKKFPLTSVKMILCMTRAQENNRLFVLQGRDAAAEADALAEIDWDSDWLC